MNIQEALKELVEKKVCSVEPVKELGAGVPFILVIQDAYLLSCQVQIVRALRILGKHGLKLVGEEGYAGRVPSTEYFGFIDDAQHKSLVAAHLVVMSRLGAAEFCDVTQEPPMELWGVDDIPLHLRSVQDYQTAATLSQQWRPRLLTLMQRLFRDGIEHLSEALGRYYKSLPNGGIPSTMAVSDSMKPETLLAEVVFLQTYGHKVGLSPEELPDFLGPLFSTAQSKTPDVKTLRAQMIHARAQIPEKLAQTDRDRSFLTLLSRIEFLYRLLELGCTYAEAMAAQGLDDPLAALHEESRRFIDDSGFLNELVQDRDSFMDAYNAATDFYQILMDRAAGIATKLLELSQRKGSDGHYIALIVGGAHCSAIENAFRGNQVSHVILTPKFTVKNDEAMLYVKKMTGGYPAKEDFRDIDSERARRFLRDIEE